MTAPAVETYVPPPVDSGLSAAQIAAIIALVDAQARLRGQLRDTAVAAAVAAFEALTDWWSTPAIKRAIADALRVVQPSQRTVARLTDAYIARAATVLTGRTVRPAGVVDVTRLRRDMSERTARELVAGRRTPPRLELGTTETGPAADVDADVDWVLDEDDDWLEASDPYGRVTDQYRFNVIADDVTEDEAKRKALVRIAAVAATDIQLAVREQLRKSLGQVPGITGYRRILRPELSEQGPCGLCVVAADRLYKKEDLLPIHDRCVCDVLPVIGRLDPGIQLNYDDLRALYEAAGSTGGGKRQGGALKKIRVVLTEHGEVGPVLVDGDQNFRGPVDVARTRHPDRQVRELAKLEAFEERLGRLLRRQAAGEDVDRAVAWQSERVERLRRELGRSRPTTQPTPASRPTDARVA
jgi:hypothetical protein